MSHLERAARHVHERTTGQWMHNECKVMANAIQRLRLVLLPFFFLGGKGKGGTLSRNTAFPHFFSRREQHIPFLGRSLLNPKYDLADARL